jgi:hypothetical protein
MESTKSGNTLPLEARMEILKQVVGILAAIPPRDACRIMTAAGVMLGLTVREVEID